ncbi:NAD(P)H-binding protein [Micromonospora sp. WMMD980]|uniref:NAD(P)-dependent oxidoreductase n=1 Tax=Micromonospora sp. WMMD980 TaxID=3016088 RepID=UPI002415BBB5|nr:NAD(P)H-binding protein [Micromonospora sp. WMMD980]MDG4799295.1 NAD(P)H-binding protein [Micromonospora sp. WMMD980]
MNIVVFGAGGRAGRAAVGEARRRGHQVTAVVRDPARHPDPLDARVVAGDVTDAESVARAAGGHDAAVSAAVDLSAPPHDFFTAAARALATGLARAGVRRLVVVGLASVLPGPSGAALMDEPGCPDAYRDFHLGHAAGLAELRACALDWAYVAPAGDFDRGRARTGRYRSAAHGDPASRISYPDFAIALLDEVEDPRHHQRTASIREV